MAHAVSTRCLTLRWGRSSWLRWDAHAPGWSHAGMSVRGWASEGLCPNGNILYPSPQTQIIDDKEGKLHSGGASNR